MAEPLQPKMDEYRKQLRNKYRDIAPSLRNVPPDRLREAIQVDADRVTTGRKPYTKQETLLSLKALTDEAPVTPEPVDRSGSFNPFNLISNFGRDIADVGKALPRLPQVLQREGGEILRMLEGRELQTPTADENPVARAASLPGIRLLPGAYVTEQLAKGEPEELARHPGIATLDVLPFKGLPAVRKAGRAGKAKVVQTPAFERVAESKPVVAANVAMGAVGRRPAQMQAQLQARINRARSPKGGPIEVVTSGDEALEASARLERDVALAERDIFSKVDPTRRQEITKAIQDPQSPGNAIDQLKLTADERAAADTFVELDTRARDIAEGRGELTFDEPTSQYYTEAEHNRLRKFDRKSEQATTRATRDRALLGDLLEPHLADERVVRLLDDLEQDPTRARRTTSSWVSRPPKNLPDTMNPTRVRDLTRAILKQEKIVANVAKLRPKVVPGKFRPAIERQTRAALKADVRERAAVIPDLERAERLIDQGMIESLKDVDGNALFTPREYAKLYNTIAGGWTDLARQGFDPVFVHRVTGKQARAMEYVPRVNEKLRKPSQTKSRTMDPSPSIEDFSVSIKHEAGELITAEANRQFVDRIVNDDLLGATTTKALKEKFGPRAEAIAARDPLKSADQVLDEMITSKYSEFHPENYASFQRAGAKMFGGDQVLLPKAVEKSIRKFTTQTENGFTMVMDPLTGLFRVSVLALSPRWNVNNILGGTILTAISQPSAFFQFFNAWKMVREGRAPIEIGTSIPKAMQQWNVEAGKTAARGFRKAGEHRLSAGKKTVYDQTLNVLDKGTRPLRAVPRAMFNMNAFMDDMFRSMNYLAGKKRATRMVNREGQLAKLGDYQLPVKSREALRKARAGDDAAKVAFAEGEGVRLARQILQTFDDLTPFERNVIRYVMPFYSWARHMVRFAFRYAMDHPVRTMITAKLLHREIEDYETGLPQEWLAIMNPMEIFGQDQSPWERVDSEGNTNLVDTRSFNPSAGFGDYFTLAGFVQQLNPVLSTPLQQLGIDEFTGEGSLYPESEYDPETGNLKRTQPNAVMNFAQNLIPQLQGAQRLAGQDPDFEQLQITNPQAAERAIQGSFGLPPVAGFRAPLQKSYNPTREVMQAESTRYRDYRDTLNDAIRTGQHGEAESRYPQLAPILREVRRLTANGVLKPYTLSEGQSAIVAGQQSVKSRFGG